MNLTEEITQLYEKGLPNITETDVFELYKKIVHELKTDDMVYDWMKEYMKRDHMSSSYDFETFIVKCHLLVASKTMKVINSHNESYKPINSFQSIQYKQIKTLQNKKYTVDDWKNKVKGCIVSRSAYSINTECPFCSLQYLNTFQMVDDVLNVNDEGAKHTSDELAESIIIQLMDKKGELYPSLEDGTFADKLERYKSKLDNNLSSTQIKQKDLKICEYEANKPLILTLDVKKGDTVILSDDLCSGVFDQIYNISNYNINYPIEDDKYTNELAKHGLIRIFVGNTCPSIIQTDDNSYFIKRSDGSRYDTNDNSDDIDDDDIDKLNGHKNIGGICTDLWNTQISTLSTLENLKLNNPEYKDQIVYRVDVEFEPEVCDVTYEFTIYRCACDEFNEYAFASFKRIPKQ